jgi:hypothetical protein
VWLLFFLFTTLYGVTLIPDILLPVTLYAVTLIPDILLPVTLYSVTLIREILPYTTLYGITLIRDILVSVTLYGETQIPEMLNSPPIELYQVPILGRNATQPGLPCHTCEPLSSSSIEHLDHCRPPSNVIVVGEDFSYTVAKSN